MPATLNIQARWLTMRRVSAGAMVLACFLAAGGVLWWITQAGTLRQRVETEIRDAMPVGTPRKEAEAWVKETHGMIAFHNPDPTGDRFVGRTVPDLSGIPDDRLKGVLRFTVRPRGTVSDLIQQVSPQQVIVYLLLDHDERVCGYFFLSLEDLRKMESEKRQEEVRP